jgi:hypothetical protein
MGLDNGATDRQSQSYAARLGSKERFKGTVRLLRVKTCSGIPYLDNHRASVSCRLDTKLPWPVIERTHRVDTVNDEVG